MAASRPELTIFLWMATSPGEIGATSIIQLHPRPSGSLAAAMVLTNQLLFSENPGRGQSTQGPTGSRMSGIYFGGESRNRTRIFDYCSWSGKTPEVQSEDGEGTTYGFAVVPKRAARLPPAFVEFSYLPRAHPSRADIPPAFQPDPRKFQTSDPTNGRSFPDSGRDAPWPSDECDGNRA